MGACFSSPPPPAWYVREVTRRSDGTEVASRAGPYTFATLVQMRREGTLSDDQLVSTTAAIHRDKAMPDGPRRVSGRWMRVDQMPDDLHRQLEAEGQRQDAAAAAAARTAALAGEGPAAPVTVG
ncbi:hypothetical protein MMPV_009569 [Pyropia vietnamensis]